MAGRSWLTRLLVNINIIVDFFMDPCDAPISVYLETLFPAVMDMLVDLYAFDVSSYQEQRPFSSLAPKDAKGKSKVRRGKKGGGRNRWQSIMDTLSSDPGELLGKRMAKHHGGTRRILTGGTSHLWMLGGALQRGAFWVFFAHRLTELFYDWYMGILAKGYCSEAERGMFLAGELTDSSHALFGWKPLVVWSTLKQRGAPNWSVTYGTTGGYSTAVSVRFIIKRSNNDSISEFFYRATTDGPGGEEVVAEGQETIAWPDEKMVGFSFRAPPWSNFVIEVSNWNGLVQIRDIYIHGVSDQGVQFVATQPWPRDFRGARFP